MKAGWHGEIAVLFAPNRYTGDEKFRLSDIASQLFSEGTRHIIIDFSECRAVYSGGVGEMVSLYRVFSQGDGAVTLNRLSLLIQDVLKTAYLDSLFAMTQEDYSGLPTIELRSLDISVLQELRKLTRAPE